MRVFKRITEQTIQSCVSEHVQNVIERMDRNMKRKFLEDLGLEKDVVDSIMAENGRDIEAAKADAKTLEAKVSTLESENSGLKSQVSDRDKQLEKLPRHLRQKSQSFRRRTRHRKMPTRQKSGSLR